MSEIGHFGVATKIVGSIWATSSRGKTKGEILVPHQNKRCQFAGFYIASKSRFEKDYIAVRDLFQLNDYVMQGY